jgi:ABC-2 type transport system permease protein
VVEGSGLLAKLARRGPAVHAYRTVIGSRIHSQLAYRTSFWLNVVTSVAVGVVEFIEIYVILANVPVFGGLNLPQAALRTLFLAS